MDFDLRVTLSTALLEAKAKTFCNVEDGAI